MRIASYGQYIPGLSPDYMVRELFNVNPFINLNRVLLLVQMLSATQSISQDLINLRDVIQSSDMSITFIEANDRGAVRIVSMEDCDITSNSSYTVINCSYMMDEDIRTLLLIFKEGITRYYLEGLYHHILDDPHKVISGVSHNNVPKLYSDLCNMSHCSMDESEQAMTSILHIDPKFSIGSLLRRCSDGMKMISCLETVGIVHRLGIYSVCKGYVLDNGTQWMYALILHRSVSVDGDVDCLRLIIEGIEVISTEGSRIILRLEKRSNTIRENEYLKIYNACRVLIETSYV